MEASPAQGHAHFSSGCGFMVGIQPKLCSKFEVPGHSHCRNIIGNPKILGSSPSPRPHPLFLLGRILWWVLANPTSLPILKSLSSVVAEIFKGNPQFWGAPLAQGHDHFSSRCDFMMGLGKPNVHTKFEVASFSRCKNIKGEFQNFRELP